MVFFLHKKSQLSVSFIRFNIIIFLYVRQN